MTSCDGSFENQSFFIAPHLDNDNVDPHIRMEFNLVIDMYNFYNAYGRRVDFGITTVCSRSNKKKFMLQTSSILEERKI